MGIFLSFLPWIIFWVISGNNNYQIGALAAMVMVIFLNIKNVKQGNVKILDLGTLIFFFILTGISFFSMAVWVDKYAAPLSNVAMFLIAVISLALRKPFTIQYAYEKVNPEFWNTPKFYTTNRTITVIWCITFAINAFLSYLYVRNPNIFFWGIIIIVLIGAIKFTVWYPDFVKAKSQQSRQVARD